MPSLAEILLEGGRLKSDALLRQAQITADAQRNKGLLWGAALSNAGQTIGQGIQRAQDLKAEAPQRAAQLAQTQTQTALGQQALKDHAASAAEADRIRTQGQAMNGLLSSARTTDPTTGLPTYDRAKLQDGMTKLGIGERWKDFEPLLKASDDAIASASKAQGTALTQSANIVKSAGYDPTLFKHEVDRLVQSHLLDSNLGKVYLENADKPGFVQNETNRVLGIQPKFTSTPAGGGVLNEQTGEVTTGAPVKAANVESKNVRVAGHDVTLNFHPDTGKYTDPTTGAEVAGVGPIPSAAAINLQLGSQQPTTPIDASRPDPAAGNKVDKVIGLTPNALYQNALTFALRGALPAGSRSAAAIPAQKAIQNKASAIAAAAGVDLPELKQEYDAASASTRALTQRYQLVSSSAQSAKDNIAYALELSPGISRTDIPAVNRFTQWLQHETGGGGQLPNLSQFELALYTAAREYAKVTTGSAASISELSQSAAQKVDQLINAAQTPDQFKAVTDGMQRDMGNITGPLFKTLQGMNDIGPNLKRFMQFVGGGGGTSSGGVSAKDPLGLGIIK